MILMAKEAIPQLYILSGPSGVGKTVVALNLVKLIPDFKKIITCTTRAKRPKEISGKDYYFLTVSEFKKRIKENRFLEWAYVHNDYYGTPIEEINKNKDKKLLLVIDVQGALQVKKKIPGSILIFLKPDSFKNLFSRLKKRGKMAKSDLETRLKKSYQKEIRLSKFYDYVIINKENKLEEAVHKIKKILDKK